jgi:hypothetical protein
MKRGMQLLFLLLMALADANGNMMIINKRTGVVEFEN